MAKLFSLDSKIYVTICRGYDPFGNPVDDNGESLDPMGRTVDIARYVVKEGEPIGIAERDAEYTREVGLRIVDEFLRHNVVESTHVLAFALFGILRDRNPKMDVLRIVRTGGADEDLPMTLVYSETDRVLFELRERQQRGEIRVGKTAGSIAEDVVADALARFASFHSRPAAVRRGDRIIAADRTLLFYYQNRLEGYGIEAAFGRKPTLTPDHRSLA
jgi:glycerol-3-phosphate O-acyltransferase